MVVHSADYLAVHSVARTVARKDNNWAGCLVAMRVEMMACRLADLKAAKKAGHSVRHLVENLADTTAAPMDPNLVANWAD